jgi:flagellum-specific ATP synthase
MSSVVPAEQLARARRFKRLCHRLEEARDMIAIGGYRPGHDPELDRAVALRSPIESFLCQDMTSAIGFGESAAALRELLGE